MKELHKIFSVAVIFLLISSPAVLANDPPRLPIDDKQDTRSTQTPRVKKPTRPKKGTPQNKKPSTGKKTTQTPPVKKPTRLKDSTPHNKKPSTQNYCSLVNWDFDNGRVTLRYPDGTTELRYMKYLGSNDDGMLVTGGVPDGTRFVVQRGWEVHCNPIMAKGINNSGQRRRNSDGNPFVIFSGGTEVEFTNCTDKVMTIYGWRQ